MQFKGLHAEASIRDRRIAELDQKLTKARHTLESLQSAQNNYHNSAKKVENAEQQLNLSGSGGATKKGKLSRMEVTTIRSELQQATAAMTMAAKRVEQMESITDLLIEQLSEREAELQQIQTLREEEGAEYQTQVKMLSSERDALIERLDRYRKRAADIEAQDAAIRRQLEDAAQRANDLEVVIEAADVARSQVEAQLQEERANLSTALEELRGQQEELQRDLLAKEEQLADALHQSTVSVFGIPLHFLYCCYFCQNISCCCANISCFCFHLCVGACSKVPPRVMALRWYCQWLSSALGKPRTS